MRTNIKEGDLFKSIEKTELQQKYSGRFGHIKHRIVGHDYVKGEIVRYDDGWMKLKWKDDTFSWDLGRKIYFLEEEFLEKFEIIT